MIVEQLSVTLVTFGHARTVSVYAFGFNGAGLNPQQTAARRRLAAFLNGCVIVRGDHPQRRVRASGFRLALRHDRFTSGVGAE
jgi:hypothetical protein